MALGVADPPAGREAPGFQVKALIAAMLLCASSAGALDLVSPLETYEESSGWGPRRLAMGGYSDTFHGGVDLVAAAGTRIRAAASGVVREVWYPPDGYYRGHPIYGAMILIEHVDGSFTRYGHLSRIDVYEDGSVLAGQTIGIIGNTGISTGTHLHFEHLQAPVIPESAVPPDPMDAFWRRIEAGIRVAEQERLGDE